MSGNEIVITTLEGQEEANRIFWASLTPLKRLELHYKMISHIYHDEMIKNTVFGDRTIVFDEQNSH